MTCQAVSMKDIIPPYVDGIWLWAYDNKSLIYTIVYLLKGDDNLKRGSSRSFPKVYRRTAPPLMCVLKVYCYSPP